MTFDRRTYAREYARRRRARERARREAGSLRCGARCGKHGACGGRLEVETDGAGQTRTTCPRCARRHAGRCVDCAARVIGRAWRCAPCKRRVNALAQEKYRTAHQRVIRRKARARARRQRAESNAYKRLWRLANPTRVRRQKAKYTAKHREAIKAYHRAYRAAGRDRPRTAARTCLGGCGAVVIGRAKKCDACRMAARRLARAALEANYHRSQERAA